MRGERLGRLGEVTSGLWPGHPAPALAEVSRAAPGRGHSCLAAWPHRPSAYYDALVRSSLGPLPAHQAHLAFSSAGVNSTRKLQELACRVLRGVAARRKTTTVELWGDSHMRNLFSDWVGLDRYASSGAAEIARQRSDCAVPSLRYECGLHSAAGALLPRSVIMHNCLNTPLPICLALRLRTRPSRCTTSCWAARMNDAQVGEMGTVRTRASESLGGLQAARGVKHPPAQPPLGCAAARFATGQLCCNPRSAL